jgi:hypothetical protein
MNTRARRDSEELLQTLSAVTGRPPPLEVWSKLGVRCDATATPRTCQRRRCYLGGAAPMLLRITAGRRAGAVHLVEANEAGPDL